MNTIASEPPALIPSIGKPDRWRRVKLAAWYAAAALIIAAASLSWWSLHIWTPLSPEQERVQQQAASDLAHARGWVWVNSHSGTYHHPGSRWYGATSQGEYLPEWMAWLDGDREAANGQ